VLSRSTVVAGPSIRADRCCTVHGKCQSTVMSLIGRRPGLMTFTSWIQTAVPSARASFGTSVGRQSATGPSRAIRRSVAAARFMINSCQPRRRGHSRYQSRADGRPLVHVLPPAEPRSERTVTQRDALGDLPRRGRAVPDDTAHAVLVVPSPHDSAHAVLVVLNPGERHHVAVTTVAASVNVAVEVSPSAEDPRWSKTDVVGHRRRGRRSEPGRPVPSASGGSLPRQRLSGHNTGADALLQDIVWRVRRPSRGLPLDWWTMLEVPAPEN
jgi:hypothetical protein